MAPTNLITLLRVMIMDTDDTNYTYSDEQLSKILVSAGILIRAEVRLEYTYKIDLSNETISPDPTQYPSVETPDDNFMTLLTLKSACILMQAELKKASKRTGKVVDGPNSYDGSKVGDAAKTAADSFCKMYADAKLQYGAGVLAGHAIMGPIRLGYYNRLPQGWYYPRRWW